MDPRPVDVPRSLRVAAALGWRFLVVVAALVVLALALSRLRLVFLPVFAALLLATALVPPAEWLARRRWPRSLATLAVMAGAALVLAGIGAAIGPSALGELEDLDVSVSGGVDEVEDWLADGPIGLSESRAAELVERARDEAAGQSGRVVSGALGGALLAIEVLAGLLLTVVLVFFFVRDGRRLWEGVVRLAPSRHREDVHEIGVRAWEALGGYLRGTTVVALADATFIGLALWLLGVPLVIPLAVLTFFGAFIPIAGAVAAGFAAAMVALVSEGFVTALLVVGVVVLVQQLEGDLLQPLVVGRAVELHPVAILLAVTAGGVLWGIPGALVAVPITAVVGKAGAYLRSRPATGTAAPAPRGTSSRG
ncbi:MAG TPA: AI-2E family transporter [Gaiellaceae bacterium]|nr:AI-2E family transporter [Gaiellaceae bacterium]